MKLQYLGTAAYEGFPALGCQCDTCARARKAGGNNLRSRSQAIVNGDLLLDFPPDSVWHFMRFGTDLSKVQACLITHSHSDHLYVGDLKAFGEYYTHCERTEKLHFYAGKTGYALIKGEIAPEHVQKRVCCEQIIPFQPFNVAGYSIWPIAANHNADSSPVLYRIEKDGKSILYAHDTGMLPQESLVALERLGRVDLLSIDATCAIGSRKTDRHLDFETMLEQVAEMGRRGIVDEKTIVVANHFSHNCKKTYDEMLELGKNHGVMISFDGMEIEF